ncbi:hypothetical protein EJ08DRAFT_654992 [Tothia fuscella]|uniref:Uncharacterized protein n=1 Tax=Tothia fuscella TaxID=1048955 RepID=A0A9P4U4M5_9PEZI|nr:hypothetical protein EJ08DRAFT_654992 [Tothia fuscella]
MEEQNNATHEAHPADGPIDNSSNAWMANFIDFLGDPEAAQPVDSSSNPVLYNNVGFATAQPPSLPTTTTTMAIHSQHLANAIPAEQTSPRLKVEPFTDSSFTSLLSPQISQYAPMAPTNTRQSFWPQQGTPQQLSMSNPLQRFGYYGNTRGGEGTSQFLQPTTNSVYNDNRAQNTRSNTIINRTGLPMSVNNGNAFAPNYAYNLSHLPTPQYPQFPQGNTPNVAASSNTPQRQHHRVQSHGHIANTFSSPNQWQGAQLPTQESSPSPFAYRSPQQLIPQDIEPKHEPDSSLPNSPVIAPANRKRRLEASPDAEGSIPQVRRGRNAGTPQTGTKKYAKLDSRPTQSLESSIYGPFQGYYRSSAEAKESLSGPKWHPPRGLNFPITEQEKMDYVKHIYDAMTNYGCFYDHLEGKSKNRMLTQSYPVEEIEARCWEVVEAAIELHEHGSSLSSWADPTVSSRKAKEFAHSSSTPSNGKGKQISHPAKAHPDHEFDFEERINQICRTVTEFKSACCDIMDGIKLQAVVYAPTTTWRTKYSNLNSNDNRKPVYADGQEIKKRRMAQQQAEAEVEGDTASTTGVGDADPLGQ